MAGIWIFAENRDQALELLTAAMGPARELGVGTAAFATDEPTALEYIHHGADEVFLLPALAPDQPLESYIPVLADAAARERPDIFFICATQRGKEIAARVAARLDTGMCSGCIGFRLDGEERLVMDRMLYGGAGIQTVVCETRPVMASIPPRTFEPAAAQEGRQGKITELSFTPSSQVKMVNRTPKVREATDITEAKIVVCVGRGVEKKEDISLVRELADALGGEVACSRPIAEELRWLPEDVYLGISGKKIKPDLYVGVGVSGQIQHVTGIRDSKIIFAVNRDENAPIFDAADYGVVGDLYQVVPKLIKELKAALKA